MRKLLLASVLLLFPILAYGQPVVGPIENNADIGSAKVTPTNAPTSIPLPTIASQQGILLDAFSVPGDIDDTASMTRAVAAGVPILLGPKTYTINNYSMAGSPSNFVL